MLYALDKSIALSISVCMRESALPNVCACFKHDAHNQSDKKAKKKMGHMRSSPSPDRYGSREGSAGHLARGHPCRSPSYPSRDRAPARHKACMTKARTHRCVYLFSRDTSGAPPSTAAPPRAARSALPQTATGVSGMRRRTAPLSGLLRRGIRTRVRSSGRVRWEGAWVVRCFQMSGRSRRSCPRELCGNRVDRCTAGGLGCA